MRRQAVDGPGEDPRDRGFPYPALAGEEVTVGRFSPCHRPAQGGHEEVLSHDLPEPLGAEAPVQGAAVSLLGHGHGRIADGRGEKKDPGGDLLSRAVTSQVPSAQEGLTAGFGMGPGVSPPPSAAWNLQPSGTSPDATSP